MPDRMTFAEAIRRVRTAGKLTQGELAAKAHLTRTTLVRLEGGLKPGPLARARLLAAFGFTNLNELLAAAGDAAAMVRIQWAGAEKASGESEGGQARRSPRACAHRRRADPSIVGARHRRNAGTA